MGWLGMEGRFITFEGTEGAGKSTQIQRIADRYRRLGRPVLVIREPGGTPAGERIRTILKDPGLAGQIAPETELLLINASRSELIRQIILPALGEGRIVLCDRFVDSTVAYQGYGRGLDLAKLWEVVGYATGGLMPETTIFLELSLEASEERRRQRESRGGEHSGADRFERLDRAFFRRVEIGFKRIIKRDPKRVHAVDALGEPEEVTERIWDVLHRKPG